MNDLKIVAGLFEFRGRLEADRAPKTCEYFWSMLPYGKRIIHVRWSGEGCWIPLGDSAVALPVENATSYAAPGQFIFYPGGFSEPEILLAYWPSPFRQQAGAIGRQLLPHHHRGSGSVAGTRSAHALGAGSGHPVRASLIEVAPAQSLIGQKRKGGIGPTFPNLELV
ncbi:DUF3830 family protein [Sphingosinicella rhizophila]|uniref:DUF3830 family protein n=1 Tax=Sphingosinicella rhizophila TaxID=3050082 RepID=A0ABU3Q6W5_9SPHN|nr:DUF3830 family protein [Sphingosinicella sp. GR2756]MDT9598690.1 DUF3830 family protein [Sphingosinicella sp. GR2756]